MSRTFEVEDIIDDEPTFARPLSEILCLLRIGGALKVLDPREYITDRQRAWYKGVCLRHLVANDENGETMAWWDQKVKRECNGLKHLKKEILLTEDGEGVGRLTTKGVGKKNMSDFIEDILAWSMHGGYGVAAPDPDLRT
jgi:hypothetical protein